MGLLRAIWELFLKMLFGQKIFGTPIDTTPPVVTAPTNVSVPVISGTEQEGRTLTCTTGTWNANGGTNSYAFQWENNGSNIGGETSSTYVLQSSDVGDVISCAVTATNSAGSASADSADTGAIVTATPNAPTGLSLTAIDGGFTAIWTEPTSNGYAITSYTVEYKKTADVSYTQSVVNTIEGNLPETATITGLDAEEYTVRVFATNSFRNGAASSTATVTPLAAQTIQSAIPLVDGKGLIAYWSAKQHDGSSVWANQIESPADGNSQSQYNITQSGTAPTWDGQKFVMNNSARWNGVNSAFIEAMHKTTAGNAWTWFTYVKTNGTNGQLDSMFGTSDVDTDTGVAIRQDSGGRLKLDQRTGTRVTGEPTTNNNSTNTLYKLVVRRDNDAGQTSFGMNSDTFEVRTHTYNASTSNPTYNFCVGSEGNNGNPMDTGVELYAMGLINRAITNAELAALNDAIEAEFTPPDPTAPGQVDSVQATASDGKAHLAWRLTDNGGSTSITYQVQYKASTSGTWIDFSTPTANTFATVTGLTNGTAYDFQVYAINPVGNGTSSSTKSCTPVVAGTAPYLTTPFKITLPVTSTGLRNGSATEILQTAFNTYDGPWFGRGDGYFDFFCPDGGATTATATYCRSELRHLTNFPWNESCEDTVRFAVISIPDNGKTIVHQIHGIDNPWIKMTYTGKNNGTGTLRALIKPNYGDGDTSYTVLSNITNGDIITSRIVYTYLGSNTGRLDVYINGTLAATSPLNRSASDGDGGAAYWKRGNYFQDVSRAGNICHVRHYTQSGQYIP